MPFLTHRGHSGHCPGATTVGFGVSLGTGSALGLGETPPHCPEEGEGLESDCSQH